MWRDCKGPAEAAAVFADVAVGDRVTFPEEVQGYTVQARGPRYLVCTKPFNARKTVIYTVVDLEERVRGTENLIFGMGAETREQCEEMLARLEGRTPKEEDITLPDGEVIPASDPIQTEVSHRNRIALSVARIRKGRSQLSERRSPDGGQT